MKESSTLVISVTIKLQHRVIWKLIFNLNMKASRLDQSFSVPNVISGSLRIAMFMLISDLHMRVSGMLVISVTIKLQHRVV